MIERNAKRIIDVNLNRACEGLRVLEDIVRFACNNEQLMLTIKGKRHILRTLFSERIRGSTIERDAEHDVGKKPSLIEEKRNNLFDTFTHNAKRVEESLRSLEEVAKLFDIQKARNIKSMRFAVYTIEKEMQALLLSGKGLGKEGIYVVLPERKRTALITLVKRINSSPVAAVQLRSKSLSDSHLLLMAKSMRAITAKKKIPFIINDRVDIALAAGADGVHLGQNDIPVKDVKKITDFSFIVGVSTHSIDEALRAENDGADYIAFGSIFETSSKESAIIQGIQRLKELRKKVSIPLVAIGGINDRNIQGISSAGADYAAVLSFVSDAKNPDRAVKKLYKNFKKGKKKK